MSQEFVAAIDSLDFYINTILSGVNKRKIRNDNTTGTNLGYNRGGKYLIPANDNIIPATETYWHDVQLSPGCYFLRDANNFVTGKKTKAGQTTIDELELVNIISTKMTDYIDGNGHTMRKMNQLAGDFTDASNVVIPSTATDFSTVKYDSAGFALPTASTTAGNRIWIKTTFFTGFLTSSPSLIPTSQTGPLEVTINFANPADVVGTFNSTTTAGYTIMNSYQTLQAAQIFDDGFYNNYLKKQVANATLKIPYFVMNRSIDSLKTVNDTKFTVDSMCINKLFCLFMVDNGTPSVRLPGTAQTNTFTSSGSWFNTQGKGVSFKIQDQQTGDYVVVPGELFEDTCHALALHDSTESMRSKLVQNLAGKVASDTVNSTSEFWTHSFMISAKLSLTEDVRDLTGASTKDTNAQVTLQATGLSGAANQVTPVLYSQCTQIATILPNRTVSVDA